MVSPINNAHTAKNQIVPNRSMQGLVQKLFNENITKKYQHYTEYICSALTRRITRRSLNNPMRPVGITNCSRNCWCISALQLLCNTPINSLILNSRKFSRDFPEITQFMKIYHKSPHSPDILGDQIRLIRKEIYEKLSHNFKEEESEPGDAREFLNLLLSKYTFSHGFKLSHDPTNLVTLLSTSREKYLFIESGPLPPELHLRELFSGTSYELQGLIFYLPQAQHYLASVQVEGKWYKCSDRAVTEVSGDHPILRENIVLLMASRKKRL